MCLDHSATNALAAVTYGRVYRRRSPAPRPLRVGNLKSPNVCSGVNAFDLLAELTISKIGLTEAYSSSLAGQLPDDPSYADGERRVYDLEEDL
jgi:hypothetical protein